jgi:hypothetical protein
LIFIFFYDDIFLPPSSGIFSVYDYFSVATIANTTVTHSSQTLETGCDGGVIYIYAYDYAVFTFDRCFFSQCNATYGGVLFLEFICQYVHINRTRFEGNVATYGNDIYVAFCDCFSAAPGGEASIFESCSTSGADNRVECGGAIFDYLDDCSIKTV